MSKKDIYLDNNATTRTCDNATKCMTNWIQSCSNMSSSNKLGIAGKTLMDKAQFDVNLLCQLKNLYHIIFTSGASESNCTILHMVVDAWHKNIGTRPHIVTSGIEHKSILDCLDILQSADRVDVTLVPCDMYGIVSSGDIEKAIRKNTALVTVMYANNELGSIQQIQEIGKIAHKYQVPFHTDAVQIFGKLAINVPLNNIDALSMSFHKLYGPPGVGILLLRKTFVIGYKLRSQIAGSQQNGLRGGTENIPAIAGAIAALSHCFQNRLEKNVKLATMRALIITLLTTGKSCLPLIDYAMFHKNVVKNKGKYICILGPSSEKIRLPNTILLSIIDFDKEFCNVKFKKLLENNGIILSIGSACNTSSKNASHVLESIAAPPIVKRGILRISLGDQNTQVEIRNFCRIFITQVHKC